MVQGRIQPRTYDERADNLWYHYNSKAKSSDSDLTEIWKADMDSTLIFAGLFSATVTSFIIEGYKLLKPDPGNITNSLLAQYLAAQIAAPNSTSTVIPASLTMQKFVPSRSAVAINILWFLSLSCNLAVVLCVTFIQKSAREYLQRIRQHKKSLECARVRTYLFKGTKNWHMAMVAQHIPTLLHVSLFLFFTGLCIFLLRENPHVFVAVIAGFSFMLFLYISATLAPLIDRAASYETPFSFLLWGLWQRFGGRFAIHCLNNQGHIIRASANLTKARHQCALYPRSPATSIKLDVQALRWVCEMLPTHHDPQSFLECIPGFLNCPDGRLTWADVCDESLSSSLQTHITALLATSYTALHIDHGTRERRALVCIEALCAITECEVAKLPRYGPQNKTINNLLTYLGNQDLLPVSWGICTLSLLSRQYLIWRFSKSAQLQPLDFKPIPDNIVELAQNADKALKEIDADCRKVEAWVHSDAQAPLSAGQVAAELDRHLRVVQSRRQDLENWIKVIYLTKSRADPLEVLTYRDLLFWHGSLPKVLYSMKFSSSVFSQETLHLYPYQLLAFMRGIGIYPKLSSMDESQADLESLLAWFPIQQQRSEIQQKYGHLCRELQPLYSLFNLLKERQTQASTISKESNPKDSNLQFLKEPTDYSPNMHPVLVEQLGPFTTIGYVLDDIKHGANVTTLVEFITRCKYFAPKMVEPRDVEKLFSIIFPKDLQLGQGPQALLAAALRVILDWEREAIPEKPCPFTDLSINFLVNFLTKQMSKDSSSHSKVGLETAEQLFVTTEDAAFVTIIRQEDRARRVKDSILTRRSDVLHARASSTCTD